MYIMDLVHPARALQSFNLHIKNQVTCERRFCQAKENSDRLIRFYRFIK